MMEAAFQEFLPRNRGAFPKRRRTLMKQSDYDSVEQGSHASSLNPFASDEKPIISGGKRKLKKTRKSKK